MRPVLTNIVKRTQLAAFIPHHGNGVACNFCRDVGARVAGFLNVADPLPRARDDMATICLEPFASCVTVGMQRQRAGGVAFVTRADRVMLSHVQTPVGSDHTTREEPPAFDLFRLRFT